ncbi:lysozyme inhibitor LprI family protein [Xanthomonas sp. WHRI 7945]|nr:lysozyme inhibitor LprI family protein [Xanthomonas campestris pv. campestris]
MTPRFVPLAGLALAALLLAPAASAASFDCAKAASPIERLLCGDANLGHQDEQLANGYAALLDSTPRAEVAALRGAQRAWLTQRNACLQQAQPVACVQRAQLARMRAFDTQSAAQAARLDRIVASIPGAPAAAAAQLRDYDGALASAWLAYLQRFEPDAGVGAKEAQTRFARAATALRAQDEFAASLLDDLRKDPKTPAGEVELTLLRNWIERSGYDDGTRPYVHCFVFARQGELAYAAMGPLYGSSRDGSAPLCAPQGGLFDLPAWTQLRAAFEPAIATVSGDAGTIRFASYAGWRVQELRATVSPLDFLQAAKVPRAPDPLPAIRAIRGETPWPAAARKAALAAVPAARTATAAWLVQHKRLPAAQADTVAAAIVADWVGSRLDFIDENTVEQ